MNHSLRRKIYRRQTKEVSDNAVKREETGTACYLKESSSLYEALYSAFCVVSDFGDRERGIDFVFSNPYR